MECATIPTTPAPAQAVFCFPPEPNIPEGPEYEKISTLYRCTGRSFTKSTQKLRQPLRPLNNLGENGSLRNRTLAEQSFVQILMDFRNAPSCIHYFFHNPDSKTFPFSCSIPLQNGPLFAIISIGSCCSF